MKSFLKDYWWLIDTVKLCKKFVKMNGFLHSWTFAACLFMSLFWKQLCSQMSYLIGFFSSWTVAKCLYCFILSRKAVVTNVTFEWLFYFMNISGCFFSKVLNPFCIGKAGRMNWWWTASHSIYSWARLDREFSRRGYCGYFGELVEFSVLK